MMNELSRDLSYAKEKVQYDAQCKQVLSQKEILAWILQRTVEEFTDMTVEEIIPYIEGKPEISAVRVYPGESNGEKISGMTNEDKVAEEGAVYYDIRFYVYIPGSKEQIKMIVNVEAQKSFYPGYYIVTRGIYYGARMISAQIGREFSIPDYDKMKKVYSIWLCMNAPQYIGNAISLYHTTKEDLLPGLPDIQNSYDKISVVIIALNEEVDSEDVFINMMNTLLSTKKTYKEKKEALENDFHIKMTNELGKEMNIMCNLSDLVEEKGIEKGKREIAKKLLQLNMGSDEKIIEATGISMENLKLIKKELESSK
ncbi:MAG: hypothetical protein U0O33_05220 [Blautia sp.]